MGQSGGWVSGSEHLMCKHEDLSLGLQPGMATHVKPHTRAWRLANPESSLARRSSSKSEILVRWQTLAQGIRRAIGDDPGQPALFLKALAVHGALLQALPSSTEVSA